MFLAGLAFWNNRELLGQTLQGVVGEDERSTNPFQQVQGGEDIMCLLSRECTNCVFPLQKQKPKPAPAPGFILFVSPKSPGPQGGGSVMGGQLILKLSQSQRASSESSMFHVHSQTVSMASLLKDAPFPRETVQAG